MNEISTFHYRHKGLIEMIMDDDDSPKYPWSPKTEPINILKAFKMPNKTFVNFKFTYVKYCISVLYLYAIDRKHMCFQYRVWFAYFLVYLLFWS